MAASSSPVEICNRALDLIGQPPIASIETPTTTAESRMARHYDPVRRALLREYVWNFAYKRGTATRIDDALFDYTDVYQFPNDLLRLISIAGQSETTADLNYNIESRTIVYNGGGAASINIRYVANIEDVTVWDDLFEDLMVLKLALTVAYAFTKSNSDVERLDKLYTKAISGAISIDGQERPPQRRETSRILSRRRSLGSSSVAGPWTIFES